MEIQPYEAPEMTEMGSFQELTAGYAFGWSLDGGGPPWHLRP